jgi:hypothetical protein
MGNTRGKLGLSGARRVKAQLRDGMKIVDIAKLNNITTGMVGRIKAGTAWRNA